jgi:hypothetical protein
MTFPVKIAAAAPTAKEPDKRNGALLHSIADLANEQPCLGKNS